MLEPLNLKSYLKMLNKKTILIPLILASFIEARPNVIIILTDDLGWGDVSYHGGSIPTPNMDKLASKGIELNRFYANPTCSPTRASLLTGLNVFNHGVIRPFMNPTAEQIGLNENLKIMPEYFQEAGYQTAMSGKWHLGMHKKEFRPINRGFETTYGHMLGGLGYFDHVSAGRVDWHRDGIALEEDGYSTELIANEAVRIIENKDPERPLFLYVAFNAPHTPIQAPIKNIENFLHIENLLDRTYAANVNKLDLEIGKIIDSIDGAGLLEETIIVFFSDNGPVFDIPAIGQVIAPGLMEARGSPGKLTGSKMYASEGGIRVPASIWWKGVIENSKTDQFFFVQDLLPTLLTATGIGIDKNIEFDGNNKWDNLLNGNLELPVNDLVANRVINDERALFNNEWKLYYSNPVMISGGAKYSLFNVMNDPYEQNDLSSSNVEIFEQMKITMMSMEENNVQPNINPVKQYLHGDTEGGEIVGSPWLEGDYKTEGTPSGFVSFFVMSWIIFLAFKLQIIGFIFILILSRILYKKFIKS